MLSTGNWKELDTVASHPIHHFRKLGFQEMTTYLKKIVKQNQVNRIELDLTTLDLMNR